MESIKIKELNQNEIHDALDLAWKVFQGYESPDYSFEGTEEFRKCLHDEEYLKGITYFGAYDHEKLVGLVGIRLKVVHICFFFVDGQYHRKGIGRKLFNYVKHRVNNTSITLNSSPYGLPFYKAIGFEETDNEQTINGIRFTPMIYHATTIKDTNI